MGTLCGHDLPYSEPIKYNPFFHNKIFRKSNYLVKLFSRQLGGYSMLSIETERMVQNFLECTKLLRITNHFFKFTSTEMVPSLTCTVIQSFFATNPTRHLRCVWTSNLPTSCGRNSQCRFWLTIKAAYCTFKAPTAFVFRHINTTTFAPFHIIFLIQSFSHFLSTGRGWFNGRCKGCIWSTINYIYSNAQQMTDTGERVGKGTVKQEITKK